MKLHSRTHRPGLKPVHTHRLICIPCRFSGKAILKCPHCGDDMIDFGNNARPPKRSDDRGWKKFLQIYIDKNCYYRDKILMEYFIWSYEHNAYWRANEMGYTQLKCDAGSYTLADATRIVANANINAVHEVAIPVKETLPNVSLIPYEDYCDTIMVEYFDDVMYTRYDGFGYWGNSKGYSDKHPVFGKKPHWATKVAWYNK